MFSFPAAFVFGIVGIIRDQTKWLALITTAISAGLLLLYLYMIGT